MKKLTLLLLTLIASTATHAYDAKINGICYNLNNTARTAEVAPADNTSVYSGEVEIPESFTYNSITYKVTAIGDYAFRKCTNLTGIVIPSTVASFGQDAFYDCTGLKYAISLIEKPFEIPKYTFYYNSPSEGVKPLSCMLFVVGSSSQLYNWKRYDGWNVNLYSDDSEFSNDVDGVKTKFRVISVKEKTCKLYDGFGAIPTSTTGVYVIPEKSCGLAVTGIGYGAFMDCNRLTGVIIPNTITDIDIIPFMNCTGLTSITIPSSVNSIRGAMFKLTNIKEVKVDEANGVYDSRDNCNAVIETSTNTLVSGCKATTIPNSVTAIADLAFEGTGIEAIDIPEQVTTIGTAAFRYCDKLVSIIIPSGVTKIGSEAFRNCQSLSSVTMMCSQPIDIEEYTFSTRANATLYIPAGSKAAYQSANYWKEFKEIVEMAPISPIIEFADNKTKDLCVYYWDSNGDGELNENEAAEVTTIGTVFKGNEITSFKELQYFTGLRTIEDCAFQNCNKLAAIILPSGLTSIGRSAFNGCSSLASIVIPNGVTNIGNEAFFECIGLSSAKFGSSVETIGENVFHKCSGLSSVELPNSLKTIGLGAFSECTGLKSAVFSTSLESIGLGAFDNCSK